jgi:hypothetical protein
MAGDAAAAGSSRFDRRLFIVAHVALTCLRCKVGTLGTQSINIPGRFASRVTTRIRTVCPESSSGYEWVFRQISCKVLRCLPSSSLEAS